jgi:hypothetical protein
MSEDLVQALGKFHLYHLILIIAPFVTVIFSLMSMKDFTLYFAQSPRSALILALPNGCHAPNHLMPILIQCFHDNS